jgi:hypothetical protein
MAKRWQICCGIWLGVKSGLLLMPWALAIPEVPLTNTLETDGVNPNDNFRALTLEARTSLAQVNPNRDRVLTEPLLTPLPGDDSPLSTPPVRAPTEADATVFAVTDIRVVGSTVFDDATLASHRRPLRKSLS